MEDVNKKISGDEVLEKYNLMIWYFTNDIHKLCKYLDRDDIYQSLAYKLLLIKVKLDSEKGNETNYVYKVLQNEATYIKRNYFSPSNRANLETYLQIPIYNDFLELNFSLNENEDDYFNPERYLYEQNINQYIDEIYCSLKDKHKKVIKMFFYEGYDIKEIAAKLKMTKKNAYTIVQNFNIRLLEKLEMK